jgi:hypothetical protein
VGSTEENAACAAALQLMITTTASRQFDININGTANPPKVKPAGLFAGRIVR